MSRERVARRHYGDEEATQFLHTTNDIAGSIEYLKREVGKLDDEIRLDNEGIKHYEERLTTLRKERDTLAQRIAENRHFCQVFDKDTSKFVSTYQHENENLAHLYEDAKKKHAQGVELLKEHFDYHPEYKRWNDDFSATPFKPM